MVMKRSGLLVFAALCIALLSVGVFGLSPKAARASWHGRARAASQNTGTISGKVLFSGTAPKRAALDMRSDPVCAGQHSETVLAEDGAVNDNGTLPNAFVYIAEVPGKYKAPSTPVTLDQTGCMYVPHVLGIMAGQPLRIVSHDATTHNVHFMSKNNRQWNQSQQPGTPAMTHRFFHPDIMVRAHCNDHPWMSAYIGVTSNPFYAVTGGDGTFTIKGLPPGEYTVTTWTATFGTQEQKVTVSAGETAEANFTFTHH